jgi:hypothetical protein
MTKVIFKFDIRRDAKNYWETANSDPRWGHDFSKGLRPEMLKMLRGKKWNENTQKKIYDLLKKYYNKDKKELKKALRFIKKDWKEIENEYFKRLARITKHPVYTKKFTVFMTTLGRCPYFPSENAFMVQIFGKAKSNVSKRLIITHEIMHLQFIHYYRESLKGKISDEKFHDIKEALTVLLNIEFLDLLREKDKGYPDHKKLRIFIEKEWRKEKDFDVLIEKCVDYLKK